MREPHDRDVRMRSCVSCRVERHGLQEEPHEEREGLFVGEASDDIGGQSSQHGGDSVDGEDAG